LSADLPPGAFADLLRHAGTRQDSRRKYPVFAPC
jgi:hypothetical protein